MFHSLRTPVAWSRAPQLVASLLGTEVWLSDTLPGGALLWTHFADFMLELTR